MDCYNPKLDFQPCVDVGLRRPAFYTSRYVAVTYDTLGYGTEERFRKIQGSDLSLRRDENSI